MTLYEKLALRRAVGANSNEIHRIAMLGERQQNYERLLREWRLQQKFAQMRSSFSSHVVK